MSENHWTYLFHKEVKSWDSTTWFRIWHLQTPAYKRYLQMHLLAQQFRFWRCWSGFSERRSQELSTNGTNVASWFAKFSSVFTSIVYNTMRVSVSKSFLSALLQYEAVMLYCEALKVFSTLLCVFGYQDVLVRLFSKWNFLLVFKLQLHSCLQLQNFQ